jgi:hypothetical protein
MCFANISNEKTRDCGNIQGQAREERSVVCSRKDESPMQTTH